MSTVPTPSQPSLWLRVREPFLMVMAVALMLLTSFATGVVMTFMFLDRQGHPAVVTPEKPVIPAKPDRPVKPIEPEPPVVTPTPTPSTPSASATPLGSAVRDYRDALAGEFTDLAAQVRSGKIKTAADVAAAARAHAAPMATAMGKAVGAYCDAAGNVTDVAGLAKEFDQAAQALGGK